MKACEIHFESEPMRSWGFVLCLLFSLVGFRALGEVPTHIDEKGPHAPNLTTPQRLEAVANQKARVQSKTNSYFEGIPAIFYKGKQCEQASSTLDGRGGVSVSIQCYDESFSPRRQCTFQWNSTQRMASFGIATYQHFDRDGWQVSEQSSTEIEKGVRASLTEVGTVATRLMAQHCGASLPKTDLVRHETQYFRTGRGLDCNFTRITRSQHGFPTDLRVACYDYRGTGPQHERLQCNVSATIPLNSRQSRTASIAFDRQVYVEFQNGGGRHQTQTLEETQPWDRTVGFHGQVDRWMTQRCHF